MAPVRWQPDRAPELPPRPVPSLFTAIGRGLQGRCPACGNGRLFAGFLRVAPECGHCHVPLGLARADDAPPYFTIVIVGHIVVPLMLWMQRAQDPSTLTLTAIFVPMTIVLALALLRPIKGATVGLMLRLNMLKPEQDRPVKPSATPVSGPPSQ